MAAGAAVLHILTGVDAERDATARAEPAGGDMWEMSEVANSIEPECRREETRPLPKNGQCPAD